MEFNCEYNGYNFTGIYQGDNTMLIKAGDEELCYVDLDNYDEWTFEDIIEDLCDDHYQNLKEIERLNDIIENLTTMTVNGDRTQIKNTAQYKIDRAIEYHDNCVNNLLDLDKIVENEKLAYQVAYEIHDNYLNILKGSVKE